MALAFVTGQPFVTSSIIGATSLEQLDSNLGSAEKPSTGSNPTRRPEGWARAGRVELQSVAVRRVPVLAIALGLMQTIGAIVGPGGFGQRGGSNSP